MAGSDLVRNLSRAVIFTLVIIFLSSGPVTAQPVSSGTKGGGLTPQQYVTVLGKGMDVDWAKTGKGERFFDEGTPAAFVNRGLQHVRIRVKDDVSEDLLETLEQQIDSCLAAGLVPVLAYQAVAFKRDPSPENMKAAVLWWTKVAERLHNKPPQLSFNLIIEVTETLNRHPDLLNQYFEAAVNAIRSTNPQRIVMISPRLRSSPLNLKELAIPSKHNNALMAEWHFYAAGPSKTNARKKWTGGSAEEQESIRTLIKAALDWQKVTGIPTWVGAWMPGNYNKGNEFSIAEQVTFARFVACELDRVRVPFAVNSDTKFYDRERGQWIAEHAPVLDAILKPGSCN